MTADTSPAALPQSTHRDLGAHLVVWALFMGLCCAYLVAALNFPLAYIWMTYEDLLGEWSQWWFMMIGMVLSCRLVWVRWRYRWFFALLGLACFYVAMEEISWGQRVFGWESSEFFKKGNLQGETNLHNFLTGPVSSNLKDAITYALAAALAGYGLVFPLFIKWRVRFALWLDRIGVAAPPLYLWPIFVGAAFGELSVLGFNEAEVGELFAGIGMAGLTLHYTYANRRGLDVHETAHWPGADASCLGLRVACISVLAVAAAVATTFTQYSTSEGRRCVDKRVRAGFEKFVGRYERYERWDIAVDLNRRLLRDNPRSSSTLRSLADAYRHLGDSDNFDKYSKRVLKIDRERYERDPNDVGYNRNLVRIHRMLGNREEAETYLQQALAIGKRRVAEHPDSASAHHSLGRTYSLMGRDEEAVTYYKKAHELQPAKTSYRKAYLKALARVRRQGENPREDGGADPSNDPNGAATPVDEE